MQLELTHFKAECRLISVLLAVVFYFNMLDPALMIWDVPRSVVTHVAVLTGRPALVAVVFLQMSLLVMPYGLMQAIAPNYEHRRGVIKLACFALCIGGVLWIYLGYVAQRLDLDTVTGIFVRNGALQIVFAGALAIALNHQQQRDCVKAAQA